MILRLLSCQDMIQNFMGAEAGPRVLLLAMGGGASEEGREKALPIVCNVLVSIYY